MYIEKHVSTNGCVHSVPGCGATVATCDCGATVEQSMRWSCGNNARAAWWRDQHSACREAAYPTPAPTLLEPISLDGFAGR